MVVAEAGGIEVIYGQAAHPFAQHHAADARNLGTVVHVVQPTQTIVPGHEDDDYTLTAPTEAAHGAGDEVLDFSGDFQAASAAPASRCR